MIRHTVQELELKLEPCPISCVFCFSPICPSMTKARFRYHCSSYDLGQRRNPDAKMNENGSINHQLGQGSSLRFDSLRSMFRGVAERTK